MAVSTKNRNTADYYFGFLQHLNADSKLDLIAKLSLSLKEPEEKPTTSLQSLFGAYQSDETAEEIIAQIRDSRVFKLNLLQC